MLDIRRSFSEKRSRVTPRKKVQPVFEPLPELPRRSGSPGHQPNSIDLQRGEGRPLAGQSSQRRRHA
jgi:hypothetical protein